MASSACSSCSRSAAKRRCPSGGSPRRLRDRWVTRGCCILATAFAACSAAGEAVGSGRLPRMRLVSAAAHTVFSAEGTLLPSRALLPAPPPGAPSR